VAHSLTHIRALHKVDDGDTFYFSTCFVINKFVCTLHEILMTTSAFIILVQVSQLGRPRCALYMNVYDMHTKFQMPRPCGTSILPSPYRNLKSDFTQDMLFFYVLQKRKITFNYLTKLVPVEKIYYHTSRGASAAPTSEIRATDLLLPTAENLRI